MNILYALVFFASNCLITNGNNLSFTIKFDQAYYQLSWSIVNETDNHLILSNNGQNETHYSIVSEALVIGDGCFSVNVNDSGGSFNGSYNVSLNNQLLTLSDQVYFIGSSSSLYFCTNIFDVNDSSLTSFSVDNDDNIVYLVKVIEIDGSSNETIVYESVNTRQKGSINEILIKSGNYRIMIEYECYYNDYSSNLYQTIVNNNNNNSGFKFNNNTRNCTSSTTYTSTLLAQTVNQFETTPSPILIEDLEYGFSATTVTIIATVLFLSFFTITIGLYQIHLQTKQRILMSKKEKEKENENEKEKKKNWHNCMCGWTNSFESHCLFGMISSFTAVFMILFVFSLNILGDIDGINVATLSLYCGLGAVVLWHISNVKLWYDKDYCNFYVYSLKCCPKKIRIEKVILSIDNSNIVDLQPFGNPKYLHICKYKKNNGQDKDQVFWKFRSCLQFWLNVRFVLMIACQILFISSFSWNNEFSISFFGIFLCVLIIDAMITSKFFLASFIPNYVTVVLLAVFNNQIFFGGKSSATLNTSDPLAQNSSIDNTFLVVFSFFLIPPLLWSYIVSLILSHKESFKIALNLMVSLFAGTFDLMTDIIVIYIWINSGNYFWAAIQICIIVISQWIILYLLIVNEKKYNTKTNIISLSTLFELFMIFIGLGKLWFGFKKLVSIASVNNNNNNNNDFERVKLWELIFESIPTLCLTSYILLVEHDYSNDSVLVSMILSFFNVSLTLVRSIRHTSKNYNKQVPEKQIELERTLSSLVAKNNSLKLENAPSNSVTPTPNPTKTQIKDDKMATPNKVANFAVPHWKDVDFSKIEREYVEPETKQENSVCTLVNKMVACVANFEYKRIKLYLRYFIIWLFSVTDSFVRIMPGLMLVALINRKYVSGSIVTFLILVILYSIALVYEYKILKNELIIKRINKNSTKWHLRIVNLIYSFYCVISNALYLMVLIELPYVKFVKKDSMYFIRYQLYRIAFSIGLLVLLAILQAIKLSHFYGWEYIMCLLVFFLHSITFYYVANNVCWKEKSVRGSYL